MVLLDDYFMVWPWWKRCKLGKSDHSFTRGMRGLYDMTIAWYVASDTKSFY